MSALNNVKKAIKIFKPLFELEEVLVAWEELEKKGNNLKLEVAELESQVKELAEAKAAKETEVAKARKELEHDFAVAQMEFQITRDSWKGELVGVKSEIAEAKAGLKALRDKIASETEAGYKKLAAVQDELKAEGDKLAKAKAKYEKFKAGL